MVGSLATVSEFKKVKSKLLLQCDQKLLYYTILVLKYMKQKTLFCFTEEKLSEELFLTVCKEYWIIFSVLLQY